MPSIHRVITYSGLNYNQVLDACHGWKQRGCQMGKT